MTRRDFLKNLFGVGVAAVAPVGFFQWFKLKPKPKPLSREQAMVEPIKKSLMHQALERKLLMVDELPQGAFARCERDVAVKSYVMSKRA